MLLPLYGGNSQGFPVSTPKAKPAPPAEAAATQNTTAESLGWQLRAALPPMRLHSITLCDHEGDVVWLSEGALGPDEHGFVSESMSALRADSACAHCESDLQDGRYGVFLAVRAPQGDLVGLVMILADSKGLATGTALRVLTQPVRSILQKISILLRPHSAMAVVANAVPPAVTVTASSAVPNLEAAPAVPSTGARSEPAPAPNATAQANTRAQAHAGALPSALPPTKSNGAITAPASSASGRTRAIAQQVDVLAMRSPGPAPRDIGSTTSVLSPLAVAEILSFELVDDDSPIPPPANEDPALALSPANVSVDEHFNGVELVLVEESATSAATPSHPASTPVLIEDTAPVPMLSPADISFSKPPPAAASMANIPVLNAAPSIKSPSKGGDVLLIHDDMDLDAFDLSELTGATASDTGSASLNTASIASTGSRLAETSLRPSPLTDPAFKDLALSVQLLSKLRPGGRTRRYEVLVRYKKNPTALDAAREILKSIDASSDIDGFVLCKLLTWLAEHPRVMEREPMTFSINLSSRALSDERFPDFIAFWLRKTGVTAETVGFELAEPVVVQHKAQAERFIAACEKMGCFIVLDDFTMDTRALDFLRSKALKLIKLDPRLTNDAMKDKLSQALVIAISQAAKVLGVHCGAKKIESQMVRRWITAIGFDFAQGTLVEGPQHVDALLQP